MRSIRQIWLTIKWLTLMFRRLMSLNGLRDDPKIVCTRNDLVSCHPGLGYYWPRYYICNLHKMEWALLPLPPPQRFQEYYAQVWFICEFSFYNCETDNGKDQNNIIQLNSEFRFKVVILIFDYKLLDYYKYRSSLLRWRNGDDHLYRCRSDLNSHKHTTISMSFVSNGILD